MSQGLRPGSFATPNLLTPVQAQIELALPPNRGIPRRGITNQHDANVRRRL
jgi:hypothetical protein